MSYRRPPLLFSSHLETIFPALLRKVTEVDYTRERIHTPDDDFLDLDWIKNDQKQCVIISHGLEGDTYRPYMKGMARIFAENNFDVLTWNYRGCSEEMNLQPRFYHSGATDDLAVVIQHAREQGYEHLNLIGFSLGGNLTLKYLGETGTEDIARAIVFSVPLDLHASCIKISKPANFLYANRFLRNLKKKIKRKAQLMPGIFETNGLKKVKTLIDFDDKYTAPLHGFEGAIDYYQKCSSINFLETIKTPTLIVNAENDPFLPESCYPKQLLKDHPVVSLEIPKQGGHVGFAEFSSNNSYWSEKRALSFINSGN